MQGKKTCSAEDGAIAAEGRHQINLIGKLGGRIGTCGRVNGEGQIMMDTVGNAAFKDNIDARIVVVQMFREANGILDNLGCMELGDE